MKKLMDSSSCSSDLSNKRVDRKDLTEDIWFEIFLLLSFYDVFKFRCVSKLWFSVLSNPCFMTKWYKFNDIALPWILVSYADLLEDQTLDKKLRRFFTIAYPDSQFRPHHQTKFLFNLVNPLDSDHKEKTTNKFIIGSSCGLVLCTTCIYNQITYYVCNPLTKQSVSLPPPPPRENNQVVAGIISNECCSSSPVSKSYRVIRIPKFAAAAAKEFKVEIFSSDLGEWNTYDVSCPQYVTWDNSIYDNLLTHNGVFYWYQQRNRNILAVCVNGNPNNGTCGYECRLINVPDGEMDGDVNYVSECLGESEGLICFARFNVKERNLNVWVLDGYWYKLHKDIGLPDQLDGRHGFNLIKEIEVVGISPVDKHVVILGSEKYVWAYNTKTRVYEQFCHPDYSYTLTQTHIRYFSDFIGMNYNLV